MWWLRKQLHCEVKVDGWLIHQTLIYFGIWNHMKGYNWGDIGMVKVVWRQDNFHQLMVNSQIEGLQCPRYLLKLDLFCPPPFDGQENLFWRHLHFASRLPINWEGNCSCAWNGKISTLALNTFHWTNFELCIYDYHHNHPHHNHPQIILIIIIIVFIFPKLNVLVKLLVNSLILLLHIWHRT